MSDVVGTLAVVDLLGVGPGHEGADAARLGLAVLDGHLLARLMEDGCLLNRVGQ